ncbi:MAG TPA: HAD-IC family P-type ATPase, partial [Myxococcota bacterium]|nr:HAD-IC family P-type ATPase [Myxococcota bacterium]
SMDGPQGKKMVAAVEKAGYGARLPREVVEAREEEEAQRSLKKQWRKAAFAGLIAVPALAMMVPGLIPHDWMGRYNALLLTPCAVVMVYSGADFYRGAWKGLKEGAFDMNSLIAAGTLASFLHAILVLLTDPHGHSYLDGIPVTIGAVLAGQAWEASARRNTGKAMRALLELAPGVALKLSEGGDVSVPVATLQKGDRVRVLPGERVPVDGVVREGKSTVDRSMLTGEPIPELVEPGQAIVGGTLNGGGLLTMEVGAVGEEAVLARMVALLQKASATRPPIASLADRVASIFVPVVLGISALSFLGWWAAGDQRQGIQAALAVLVVACPCALGLATPISLVLGLGNAAKRGILLRSGEALQGLSEVDTVVFDKTGTLTVGHPVMQSMQAEGMEEAELLRLAAAVERRVIHPLARAVVRAAGEDIPEVEGLQSYPGKGAEGTVEG